MSCIRLPRRGTQSDLSPRHTNRTIARNQQMDSESERQNHLLVHRFAYAGAFCIQERLSRCQLFFRRDECDRSRASKFFTTLEAQLGSQEPALMPHVQNAIDTNPAIFGKAMREQFEKLVLELLLQHELAQIRTVYNDSCDILLRSRGSRLARCRPSSFPPTGRPGSAAERTSCSKASAGTQHRSRSRCGRRCPAARSARNRKPR